MDEGKVKDFDNNSTEEGFEFIISVPREVARKEEAELKTLEADLRAKTPTLKGKLDIARHQAVLTRQRNKMEAEHKKIFSTSFTEKVLKSAQAHPILLVALRNKDGIESMASVKRMRSASTKPP